MINEENPFEKYRSFELNFGYDMSIEEKIAAVREVGKKAEKDFKIKYDNINEWFKSDYDQLYILSICLRYFLMAEEGYDEEASTGKLSFAPHYLEILQALSLTHERTYSGKPLMNKIEKLRNDLKEVGTLIQTKLLNLPMNIETEKDISAYRVRTDVMGYNMAVRNWAYYHQMQSVACDMARLVKEEFIKVHNVCPVEFVNLLFALSYQVEVRINEHLDKLRAAFSNLMRTQTLKVLL